MCWFLRRGENRSTRRKTSRSKDENQQQTQPTYDTGTGSRTRATLVGGERSHHCAIPAPYVVMTPIFPTNQRKCVISSRIVAILTLLSTQLNTVLNRLIDSQHCKRHRRKRMREFHLHSLIIHITSQPKTSF